MTLLSTNSEAADSSIMPFVYDDLYEICCERRFMAKFGISGKF